MKYKTLFQLAIKLVGVLIVAEALARNLVFWLSLLIAGYASWNWAALTVPLGHGFSIAIGIYLFFGGRWIVNLGIPGNRPYCPECAYDLTGAVEPRCPECGTPFRWEDVRPKTEVQSAKFEEKKP